jgi:hypothetical protein
VRRLTLCGVALLAPAVVAGPAVAAPAQGITYEALAKLPPARQAAIMQPLRDVAAALDAVGRSTGKDIYSGVEIDATTNSVTVYLTRSGKESEAFLTAAPPTSRRWPPSRASPCR